VVAPLACICRMIGGTFAAWSLARAWFAAAPLAWATGRFVRLPSDAPWAFVAAKAARVRSAIKCRSFSARYPMRVPHSFGRAYGTRGFVQGLA
jgi:hypothetical protein